MCIINGHRHKVPAVIKEPSPPSSLGSKALLITATPAFERAMTIIGKSLLPCARSMRIRRKSAGTLRKSFVCVAREKGNISQGQAVPSCDP